MVRVEWCVWWCVEWVRSVTTPSTVTDEDKMLIASLGGVKLVLSALKEHSSDVGVQESGLLVLESLAMNGLWGAWWWLWSDVRDDGTPTVT